MTGDRPPGVGDLVRDPARDCEAVVTDVCNEVPLLRSRHGGGEPWPASPLSLEILARRGKWVHP
ncbi:hypothetical protein AB0D04_08645 [Streptomyces sp. NPDC048483]|uniref:hypothetical protein n=1 Tax=Streptomyces sp. NPDC048483 TaxID=3154927 RepID=UPI003443F720